MAKGGEVMVVQSKVKAYVKKKGCSCGGDVAAALTKEVVRLLDAGAARAKANGRKTVKSRDI